MIVGVPKEIKTEEYRVGLVPAGARALTKAGHQVLVEKNAGMGALIPDDEYRSAGAEIVETAADVYGRSDMVIKVKEPQAAEYGLLREDQILFAYLHLAPAPELTAALLKAKCIGVAFETIQLDDGSLPLLTPMSEVAGRMSVLVGASYLTKTMGGRGVLLGGVPGVARGKVTVLGAGVVGLAATKMAVGLGAEVTVLDVDQKKLQYLDDIFGSRITALMSNQDNIFHEVIRSNLVIGAVLIPGGRAPKLVSAEQIRRMKAGSVIVDVAIDQGGCVEGARPTTHVEPVIIQDETILYCVANMLSVVSRTSTFALANQTLPYALRIADRGVVDAIRADHCLAKGLNVASGQVTYKAVADDLGYDCAPWEEVL